MAGETKKAEACLQTGMQNTTVADKSVPTDCLASLPALGKLGKKQKPGEQDFSQMVLKTTVDPESTNEEQLSHLRGAKIVLAEYNIKLLHFSDSQSKLFKKLEKESTEKAHANHVNGDAEEVE